MNTGIRITIHKYVYVKIMDVTYVKGYYILLFIKSNVHIYKHKQNEKILSALEYNI